ncbi:MAG: glycoside hydrolase family 16 protein [Treponema sp.]|nr:glycoside hydrolase family 16 protein [Treponema sp.]
MKKIKNKLFTVALVLISSVCTTSCFFFDIEEEEPVKKDDMTLVWFDEFDYTGVPERTKWKYQTGTNAGWGNNELQNYLDNSTTATTAIVEDGCLKIKAFYDNGWKSARLNSKAHWKYGYIEARLKVTNKKGAWPAFWMMPQTSDYGQWPDSGEIDIMENAPSTCGENRVFSTLHARGHYADKGKGIGSKSFGSSLGDEWHTFAIKWDENKITAYYDDVAQDSYTNDGTGSANWPYDKDFYIILNLAIGGNLGGSGDAAKLQGTGAEFLIDYVRVYQ